MKNVLKKIKLVRYDIVEVFGEYALRRIFLGVFRAYYTGNYWCGKSSSSFMRCWASNKRMVEMLLKKFES